ncbi:hypothetical protein EVAR_6696_1 [Eumeta japonica]|uniref:Uncharacterized protein n=1 Tax=Eumeta variegata TaxID=151549 RepID=A0A4C1TLG8_EUMVA|nr:hypothetical protein EVAR_6696_1 [Eumeta japonica]
MKDASKRYLEMAQSHPNPLIASAAIYEPPPAHHFLRRPPEYSFRSAGRPHFRGRQALRSKKTCKSNNRYPPSQQYDHKGHLTGAFPRNRHPPPKVFSPS